MQNESQKDNQYFKNSEGVFLILSKFNIFIFLSSKKFSFSPINYPRFIYLKVKRVYSFFFHKYILALFYELNIIWKHLADYLNRINVFLKSDHALDVST